MESSSFEHRVTTPISKYVNLTKCLLQQKRTTSAMLAALKAAATKDSVHSSLICPNSVHTHSCVFWYQPSNAGAIFRALFRFVENKTK